VREYLVDFGGESHEMKIILSIGKVKNG